MTTEGDMGPRKVSEFPIVNGRRFQIAEEPFAFHGFKVVVIATGEKVAMCQNRGMAELVERALEELGNASDSTAAIETSGTAAG